MIKFFKSIALALSLATSCALSGAAHAQYVSVNIESATITQLFSATFDGLVFGKAVVDDGTFFGAVPDVAAPVWGVNRTVNVVDTGGTGRGVITFDGTELDELAITLPNMHLTIIDQPAPPWVEVDAVGASLHITAQPDFDGGDDANFDVGGLLSAGNTNVEIDFSKFNNIVAAEPGVVKSCTDGTGNCSLLPALNLDGVRYTLEGSLTLDGGDTLTLRVQTDNNSYYEIEMVTQTLAPAGKDVPIPAFFVYLTMSAIGLLGALQMRRRKVK